MRDILFRAKRVDNGEWEYGGFAEYGWANESTKPHIVPYYASALYGMSVDPNTVGQYTGLDDRDGNKIFEGDIVSGGVLSCGGGYSISNNTSEVSFGKGMFIAGGISLNSISDQCSVIGNIYDNKENSEVK